MNAQVTARVPQNAEGTGLGPFDCWLLLRGLKTMDLRMERQVANCSKIATFLDGHPLVKKVNYPGLGTHTGSDVQRAQALNGGSLLSFETGRWDFSRLHVLTTYMPFMPWVLLSGSRLGLKFKHRFKGDVQ